MTDVVDFTTWLEENKLSEYLDAFQAEGYDDLEVLIELTDEEIVELMNQLNIKKGHRVKLPLILKKAKQVAGGKAEEEQRKEQRKREEEQRKEEMDRADAEEERALAKKDAQEDRVEERKLAKQERQKKAAAMDPGTEQSLAADKPEEVLLPAHKKVSACVHLRAAV